MMDDSKTVSNSRLYKNAKFSDNFFTQLKGLFAAGKFTDVALIAGAANTEIPCHKVILAALSPYFAAMFSSNLLETQTNKVVMKNADHAALSEMLNYAYSGAISLNVNNVQNILILATLLQVKQVEEFCCDYMQTQLDTSNCIDAYCFAKRHMYDELAASCQEYIGQNFVHLHKTNELARLSDLSLLCELLSSDHLDISSEMLVLDAACKWISGAPQERALFLDVIVDKCVRLSLLDEAEIGKFLQEHSQLLAENKRARQALVDRNNNANERKRVGMTKAATCFLLVGGNCDMDDGFYVNCFNPLTGEKFFLSRNFHDKFKLFSKGYFTIENPGVCVTQDNRIFVCGGNYIFHEYKLKQRSKLESSSTTHMDTTSSNDEFDYLNDGDEILSKELYEYDNAQDTWLRRANMLYPKANFSLCAMARKLYSFGGITKDQDHLDIVEAYDLDENKWEYVGTMPTPFIAGSVVGDDDGQAFYVLGGRSGGMGRFNSCYKFLPATRAWSDMSAMRVGRFNFGACLASNRIYVFGGQRYDESEHSYYTREALDCVEVYDLETREWSECVKMPGPLYNTGVCVASDKCIYVCGTTECKYSGNTLFGFMFTSVFRLDVHEQKWTVVEHDVSDIKVNYRAVAANLNTKKLHKCASDIEVASNR